MARSLKIIREHIDRKLKNPKRLRVDIREYELNPEDTKGYLKPRDKISSGRKRIYRKPEHFMTPQEIEYILRKFDHVLTAEDSSMGLLPLVRRNLSGSIFKMVHAAPKSSVLDQKRDELDTIYMEIIDEILLLNLDAGDELDLGRKERFASDITNTILYGGLK